MNLALATIFDLNMMKLKKYDFGMNVNLKKDVNFSLKHNTPSVVGD